MPSLALEVVSTPDEVVASALKRFEQDRIAISFSGAEDVVLIDMAAKLVGNAFSVFTLDTGRLHAETYEFIDRVREHYDIQIEVLSPDNWDVEELVREKGLFSFYEDGHTQCCGIRKIAFARTKARRTRCMDYRATPRPRLNTNECSSRTGRHSILNKNSRNRQVQSSCVMARGRCVVLYPETQRST